MHRLRAIGTDAVNSLARHVSGWLTLAIAAAASGLAVFTGMTLFNPVLDAYGFRQTQTAIGVYWMLHDHVFLDYLTPVLGAPWSLPFEGPVYQTLVASLTYLTGLELDASGRIVSVAFFLLALASGYEIIKILLPDDRYAARLFLLLGLVSPLYVFWARTFMIETCALGLGAAWLACVMQKPDRGTTAWFIASVPLCILAAFAKATTWPAFVTAYGLYFVFDTFRTRTIKIVPTLITACGIVAAFAILLMWNGHSDQLKLSNGFASHLTSRALWTWNFGTWSQLFRANLWLNIVPLRMLPDAIGYGWPLLFICFRYVRADSIRTMLALAGMALFLLPVALFTNLHIVHQYYQSANAIFAVAAATFLLSELAAVNRRGLATFVTVLLVAGALWRFASYQWPIGARDLTRDPFYIAANLVKERTRPDTALIVLGIDWSSEVHYYAERKGLALPMWSSVELTKRSLENPDAMMGGLKTSAVVDCRAVQNHYRPELDVIVDAFVSDWSRQSQLIAGPAKPGLCAVYIKAD